MNYQIQAIAENTDRKYDFSYQTLAKKMKLKQRKSNLLMQTLQRLTGMFAACIGSQLISALIFLPKSDKNSSYFRKIAAQNYRSFEFMSITFAIKLLIDSLDELTKVYMNQYQKGALTGLLSYLINRPIDQIQTAQRQILAAQGKKINRIQGLKAVLRYDGFIGLYKFQNILGPISATIHRSIYFGLYYRLSKSKQYDLVHQMLTIPFATSLGASLATFLPDKLRSFYIMRHQERNSTLVKRNKKNLIDAISITSELAQLILKGQYSVRKEQIIAVGKSVFKNWVALSFFVTSQMSFCQNAIHDVYKVV